MDEGCRRRDVLPVPDYEGVEDSCIRRDGKDGDERMKLDDATIMKLFRLARPDEGQTREMTFTRWKDGIDIEEPTATLSMFATLIAEELSWVPREIPQATRERLDKLKAVRARACKDGPSSSVYTSEYEITVTCATLRELGLNP